MMLLTDSVCFKQNSFYSEKFQKAFPETLFPSTQTCSKKTKRIFQNVYYIRQRKKISTIWRKNYLLREGRILLRRNDQPFPTFPKS